MAPNKIIIDTDPGVDDVLAMLLAFSAKAEELEVLLLSVTFGNVDVKSCLRNIVTMFHTIGKERAWRKSVGRPEGFEALMARKPLVAVGATEPLAEQMMVADFFHGTDGLGGIHESHPHLSPAETWKLLFEYQGDLMFDEADALQQAKDEHTLFEPSFHKAPREILRVLAENDPNTVTIVAIGPLTNLAFAAATDPETFLRVKDVVVMGGAVDVPGNMTPGAEFNTYADSVAAALVFALTSPNPRTTMPPPLSKSRERLMPDYPTSPSKPLSLKLFPLDITSPHLLPKPLFKAYSEKLEGSPLAQWAGAFLSSTYQKIWSMRPDQDIESVGLELHDPLTIWYALSASDQSWKFKEDEDIRVETTGQWTRGACIVDRRGKGMSVVEGDVQSEVIGDAGGWLDSRRGNRISRCVGTPGEERFAGVLLERVFGDAE